MENRMKHERNKKRMAKDEKKLRNCWISSYLYVTCASCDSKIFVVHSKPLSRARLNWTNWFVNVFKTCEEYEHWSESEFDNWQKFPFCRSKILTIYWPWLAVGTSNLEVQTLVWTKFLWSLLGIDIDLAWCMLHHLSRASHKLVMSNHFQTNHCHKNT